MLVGARKQGGAQLGILLAIASHRAFVKDFAEAEDIRRSAAGSFRSNVTGRPDVSDVSSVGLHGGDEPDISELGRAVHKNNVGRFDVAMNQFLVMELFECGG